MTTLVHRRRLPPVLSEPRGPGGTIGPALSRQLAPLTWVGWLSIVAAVAYLLSEAWTLLAQGGGPQSDSFLWLGVVRALGAAAAILAPAALELGYPGVGRRNARLLTGLALLALAVLLRPVVGFASDRAADILYQGSEVVVGDQPPPDPTMILIALHQSLDVGRELVTLAGWVWLCRGLLAAGSRPPWRLVVIAMLAVVVVDAAYNVAFLPALVDAGVWVGNVVTVVVGMVVGSAATAAAVILIWGARRGLLPTVAWRLGAAAAASLLAVWILALAFSFALQVGGLPGPEQVPVDMTLLTASTTLGDLATVLLFGACLAGLGRGPARRRVVGPRRRRFQIRGDQRLREASA